MLPDKANPICLLLILCKYSDENHILTMREIIKRMKADYGVSPDRRTIYSSISLLIDLGFEISTYKDNGVGYYLEQRLFETSEVRLLMDAVYSFFCLPSKHTEDLIKKLQKLLSVHERKHFEHLTVVRSEKKTANRQVFWNIEQLDKAISKKVKVRFTYLQYDLNKKLVPRREEIYTVNPYSMVFSNDNYYLVCIKDNKDSVSMYRIDRMRDIEVTECKLDSQKPDFNPSKFTEHAVYAYPGEPEHIRMNCRISILDHVIDNYGTNINIHKLDDENIEICFTASPYGVKYWALQYLPYVEVIYPIWLRDEIIESIKENPYFEIYYRENI